MANPLFRKFGSISIAMILAVSGFLSVALAQPASASPCASWVQFVDISSNNAHPFDWKAMEKAGVAGVYIKNSEGTSYVNGFWNSDVAASVKYGLPYGGYYFARPGRTDAVASARYFVDNGGTKGQLPPALDLEVTKLSPEATARWALLWLQTVQQLSGRKPIIYVGYYFPASQFSFFAPYDLWLPAYPNGYKPVKNVCVLPLPKVPAPWVNIGWQAWQFTSVGLPAGTHNHTDISVALPDWFEKWTGAGILPPSDTNKIPVPLYSTGSHGVKVTQIQTILVKYGYLPKGSADGWFGVQTKAALEKYQQRLGIKGDGAWAAATQTASDYFIDHGYTMVFANNCKAMAQAMNTISLQKVA